MSRVNRPPVSTSRLAKSLAGKKEGSIGVVVGSITDDTRLLTVPKMTVAALHFTAGARARIAKAGGEALTFDQLALRRPTGANTVLLRGPKTARLATRYFGAAGVPGSTTRYASRIARRPYLRLSSVLPPLLLSAVRVSDPRAASSSVLAVAERAAASRCKARAVYYTTNESNNTLTPTITLSPLRSTARLRALAAVAQPMS